LSFRAWIYVLPNYWRFIVSSRWFTFWFTLEGEQAMPEIHDTTSQVSTTISQETFRDNFSKLVPLIVEEWPQIDQEVLENYQGDLDQTIDYIASQSERTRTLVRLHLAELSRIANLEDTSSDNTTKPRNGRSPSATSLLNNEVTHKLDRLLDTLENRAEKILTQVETEVSQKARENIGVSLLAALGLGFILGLLFGGNNRDRS
jgi:hypothetical protein